MVEHRTSGYREKGTGRRNTRTQILSLEDQIFFNCRGNNVGLLRGNKQLLYLHNNTQENCWDTKIDEHDQRVRGVLEDVSI